jgi:hypothetical protein
VETGKPITQNDRATERRRGGKDVRNCEVKVHQVIFRVPIGLLPVEFAGGGWALTRPFVAPRRLSQKG